MVTNAGVVVGCECCYGVLVLLYAANAAFLLMLHTFFRPDCRGYREFFKKTDQRDGVHLSH